MYVDGSKLDQNAYSLAGWGVVFFWGEIRDILCGPVVLNKYSDVPRVEYIGAEEGTNNTGELTAIAMAVRLAMHLELQGTVNIYYDSTYSANAAQGFSLSNANHTLIDVVRRLIGEANKAGTFFKFTHIYSHTNDHLNDTADYLAKLGARGVKL